MAIVRESVTVVDSGTPTPEDIPGPLTVQLPSVRGLGVIVQETTAVRLPRTKFGKAEIAMTGGAPTQIPDPAFQTALTAHEPTSVTAFRTTDADRACIRLFPSERVSD